MTEEYRASMEDAAYLCACAVNGETPDPARIAEMDLKALYRAASRHLLTGIVGCALESAGVRDPAFTEAKAKAIRKLILLDTERDKVLHALDRAGIWYMPLKGTVLKKLYPALGMRQMADVDILFDRTRAKEVRDIMEGLGFENVRYGQCGFGHDQYDKPPVCHFELHRSLFVPGSAAFYQYYQNVKDRLIKDGDGSFAWRFTDEDFYIYMIAHEYKHFSKGGTGLRSVLDTYVYCTRRGGALDWVYIEGELEKLGIADFEKTNRGLALALFGGMPLSDAEREMLDYILSSGTYGTTENSVNNCLKRYGGGRRGKLRYICHRLVLPVNSIKVSYPLFWKLPILLPFLPFYRACRGFVSNRRALLTEYKTFKKAK